MPFHAVSAKTTNELLIIGFHREKKVQKTGPANGVFSCVQDCCLRSLRLLERRDIAASTKIWTLTKTLAFSMMDRKNFIVFPNY